MPTEPSPPLTPPPAPSPPPGPAGLARPLWISLLVAALFRVLLMVTIPPTPTSDAGFYLETADHLAHGRGYALRTPEGGIRLTAAYPVGYPAAIAVTQRLTGASPVHAALGLNLLAALAATACAAWLGFRWTGARGAYAAGMGYALYPGGAYWAAFAMTETLAGALLVAFCALSYRIATAGARWKELALAGVVLAAGVYVRPQMVLTLPALVRWRRPLGPSLRRAVVPVLAVCAIAVALVVPWRQRNCAVLDQCATISTLGGYNLLMGTDRKAMGGVLPPVTPCWDAAHEARQDGCMAAEGRRNIVRHPLLWIGLAALKLARTLIWEHSPPDYAHIGDPRLFAGRWRVAAIALCTLAWYALMALSAAGARRLWREGGDRRQLVASLSAGVLQILVASAVFLGTDRFHLMMVPLLTPLAAGLLLPRARPA